MKDRASRKGEVPGKKMKETYLKIFVLGQIQKIVFHTSDAYGFCLKFTLTLSVNLPMVSPSQFGSFLRKLFLS